MEAQEPPIYIVVPGSVYRRDSDATHTPMFHQLEGLAVDEDITLATSRACCSSSPARCSASEREVRLRSGYFPFTEPSVEVDISCFRCGGDGHAARRRRAARSARAPAGSRSSARGWSTRTCYGFVRRQGLRPRAGPGLRVRHGHRPDRDAQARRARPARRCSRTTCASWSSSAHEGPVSPGCARYCDPGIARRGARRAAPPSTAEVEQIDRIGVGDPDALRDRQGAERRAAPRRRPADASARSTTARASRARSSAARPTSPPARPWRWRCPAPSCPTARSSARPSCAASSRAG